MYGAKTMVYTNMYNSHLLWQRALSERARAWLHPMVNIDCAHPYIIRNSVATRCKPSAAKRDCSMCIVWVSNIGKDWCFLWWPLNGLGMLEALYHLWPQLVQFRNWVWRCGHWWDAFLDMRVGTDIWVTGHTPHRGLFLDDLFVSQPISIERAVRFWRFIYCIFQVSSQFQIDGMLHIINYIRHNSYKKETPY